MDVHAEGSKAAAARSSAVDEKVNNERAGLLDMKGKHREQSKGEVTGQNTNHEDLNEDAESVYDSDDDESLHCAICLSVIDDRTVIQPCCHGRSQIYRFAPSIHALSMHMLCYRCILLCLHTGLVRAVKALPLMHGQCRIADPQHSE